MNTPEPLILIQGAAIPCHQIIHISEVYEVEGEEPFAFEVDLKDGSNSYQYFFASRPEAVMEAQKAIAKWSSWLLWCLKNGAPKC